MSEIGLLRMVEEDLNSIEKTMKEISKSLATLADCVSKDKRYFMVLVPK